MELNNLLKLYKAGNFKLCHRKLISEKKETLKDQPEEYLNLNETILLENNLVLCQAIVSCSNGDIVWSKSMESFMDTYSKYRSLTTLPLDLELNIIYNTLWWFLIKPQCFLNNTFYVRSLLKAVSICLSKVLRTCCKFVLEKCPDDVWNIVKLLQKSSDQMLHLPPVISSQLLSVMSLTVLVLMEQSVDEVVAKCELLMRNIINQADLLRLHLKNYAKNGKEEFCFKFGLTQVNSTASMTNCEEVIDAFIINGSVIGAMNGDYQYAIHCLKSVPESSYFPFLVNYLKAYCCLKSGEFSEGKLYLAYTSASPMSDLCQAHYRLLLACLHSGEGDHQTALVHCDTALALAQSRPRLASLAAHLAASQADKLQLPTNQLNYLKLLVQFQKESIEKPDMWFKTFEEVCLTLLYRNVPISLHSATYALARNLLINEHHMKALELYKEVLHLLKSGTHEEAEHSSLPHSIQVFQEAELAHYRAKNFEDGEKLCRQLVRDYIPQRTAAVSQDNKTSWEVVLYSLEEDIVSSVLLADMLANLNKSHALEELSRSYNVLLELREQVECNKEKQELKSDLCDWILSRILLRKAQLSNAGEAIHYFRRALIHKPGDKEVIYHYKQWSLQHPDHISFDPGDHVVLFPEHDLHNLALRHILQCSVTDAEWTALVDLESSHDVLESLFDDDD